MLPQIKRSILSQETWDKFPEEEKNDLRKFYNDKLSNAKGAEDRGFYDLAESIKDEAKEMEWIFGKKNLLEPKAKTWRDIEVFYTDVDIELGRFTKSLGNYSHYSSQLLEKCVATLKITKLIELGYGGAITDKEYNTYKNSSNVYFNILCEHNGMLTIKRLSNDDEVFRNILTFRSFELAKEFMSYSGNVKLIKQYYMI